MAFRNSTENPKWVIWLIWAIVGHYMDKKTHFLHILSHFVRVLTHYGSNESNDSFGFFVRGNTTVAMYRQGSSLMKIPLC